MKKYAKADLDTASIVVSIVDEINLRKLRDFRIRTGVFDLTYPLKFFSEENEENSYIDTKVVSDG